MTFTIKVEKIADSKWKASFEEMPHIFYSGNSESEVRERIEKLAHALRSPHIHVDRVLPNGDVILTLSRFEDGHDGLETTVTHSSPFAEAKKSMFHIFQRLRASA